MDEQEKNQATIRGREREPERNRPRDGPDADTPNKEDWNAEEALQADFCNPGKGSEKGNVENKAGYSRRNLFVPVPTTTDFVAFNAALWEKCAKDAERERYRKKRPIRELWEEERGKLLKLSDTPYNIFRYVSTAVNKCGFATVDTNRIFPGSVGTGNTHLTTALALLACQSGKKVRFFIATGLANLLMEKTPKIS